VEKKKAAKKVGKVKSGKIVGKIQT